MIGDLAMRLLQAVVAAQIPTASVPADHIETVTCLAQNIWFEARGSSVEDQLAVAHVVLNRVEDPRYPDDVCAVVWQPDQFSWTQDGLSDHVHIENPIDQQIWKEAVRLAMAAMAGEIDDPTGGATHYHADHVTPNWAGRMDLLIRIDDHLYYRHESPPELSSS
ncbi:MAG: cell wall hydrolase [Alphaproteobacteria bacterium]